MIPQGKAWKSLERTGFLDTFGPIYFRKEAAGSVFAFRVEQRHADATGSLSTGALMVFTDYYVGLAAVGVFDVAQVTMQLQTNVIGHACVGDWVEGRARLIDAKDRLAYLRGTAAVGDRVISTADGIWKQVPAMAAGQG